MSIIEKARFLHNEYVEYMKTHEKAGTAFKAQCCREIGLVFDEGAQSAALRKHDNLFQIALRSGPVWDMQETIFQMWERNEVKGQKVTKEKVDPSLLFRGKDKRVDISFRPLADDMKIVHWRSLQGIKDEKIISAVLSRVISKDISLEEMTVELEQHKIFFRMQEQMMLRLNCGTWEEVQKNFPLSSSEEALKFHSLAFKNIKSRANPRSLDYPCPAAFLAHLDVARQEKERKERLDTVMPVDQDTRIFTSSSNPLKSSFWSVFNIDVKDMVTKVPRRDYSLAVADIPYGFRMKGSVLDEVAYTYPQINSLVQNFKQLTTCNIWTIIIFHSTNQAAAVAKALKDNTHGYEVAAWHKPNLKRAMGVRMISSFEMFSIGYYSSIDLCKTPMHCRGKDVSNMFTFPAVTRKLRHQDVSKEIVNPYQKPQRLMNELIDLFSYENNWILDLFSGSGTTTVCALKKGRNSVAIEKDPIQAAFIAQRICAIDDLPDEDQEVGAKFIEQSETFGNASLEPQPPIKDEPGLLAEIEEEGTEFAASPLLPSPAPPCEETLPDELLDV